MYPCISICPSFAIRQPSRDASNLPGGHGRFWEKPPSYALPTDATSGSCFVAEPPEKPGMKDDRRAADMSSALLFQLLPSSTFSSERFWGVAAVMDTHRRPEHSCAASAGSAFRSAASTSLSREPAQPRAGLHMLASLLKSVYCCCRGMLEQVSAALMEPPEAPATRVLLVMMPSCFRMAARAIHATTEPGLQRQQAEYFSGAPSRWGWM